MKGEGAVGKKEGKAVGKKVVLQCAMTGGSYQVCWAEVTRDSGRCQGSQSSGTYTNGGIQANEEPDVFESAG